MGTTLAPAPAIGILNPGNVLASEHAKVQRPASYTADLRIDGWLVEPTLNLLTRDGACVRLRAQLMDLLLCLASHPGKVFRKDELVAEVWEGRWIAQSALSRCVAELRAALGDDAQRPRVIETITKRGYRLIAPVELVAAPQEKPSPVAMAAAIEAAHTIAASEPDAPARSLWQRLKLSARRPA
jgi:DNA-binding winged helix-turn-helix (wHTH) protein